MIVVTGNPEPVIRPKLIERENDGYKYACAAAIQNMLLAAHGLGLGSLWFTFFDRDLLRTFLNIESHKHPVAIVCLGYPDTTPPSPGRLPLHSKVRKID